MIKIIPVHPERNEKQINSDSFIEILINSKILNEETKILVGDKIAYDSSGFRKNFQGSFSSITESDSNTTITIDPEFEFDKNKEIKVVISTKLDDGSPLSDSYSFYTENLLPQIFETNITEGRKITSPESIYIEFIDYNYDLNLSSLDISLNKLKLITSGSQDSSYISGTVSINNDSTLIVRISPDEFFRNDNYILKYSISNTNGNTLFGKINFSIKLNKVIFPPVFPPSNSIEPISIDSAQDIGVGDSIRINWKKIVPRYDKSDVFMLTYKGLDRLKIFDAEPFSISNYNESDMIINNLKTGTMVYFASRMLEAYKDTFDFSGMVAISEKSFKIPEKISVSEIFNDTSLILNVSSVSGYPKKGLLLLDNYEVVKYIGINSSENYFIIDENGRGLNGTSRGTFIEGDEVKLFLACQDKNKNIISATPTFTDDNDSGRTLNNIGFAVPNFEDTDRKFFQGYDFCGYHHKMPQKTLTGVDDCGTYLGGEFNGSRGFNVFDRVNARNEVLLDQVGEPCVLLKRKWDGQTCSCVDLRRVHPRIKTCKKCYGTGYIGGFDQYLNTRRADKRVLIRFGDVTEDLNLSPHQGLNQVYESQCWTLFQPIIKDRDILIRHDYTDDREYVYEVLDSTREKFVYRHFGRQRLRVKRLDKTDIYYTLNYTKFW